MARAPGHQKPEHVAQVVSRVSHQRHRVGEKPERRFDNHKAEVQSSAQRECGPEVLGNMTMAVRAVTVRAMTVPDGFRTLMIAGSVRVPAVIVVVVVMGCFGLNHDNWPTGFGHGIWHALIKNGT